MSRGLGRALYAVRGPAFALMLVHSLGVSAGALMVHAGDRFALGARDAIVGILLVVASVLLLHALFRPVSGRLALLMALFGWAGCAIQALDTLADTAALMLLHGIGGPTALPVGQAQALAFLAVQLHAAIYYLAFAFFGGFAMLLGWLVLRSSFLPRVLGVFLAIDGLGYFAFSLTRFVSPASAVNMVPFVPYGTAVLGEGVFMLWLLVRGVNSARWAEQAAAASP